MALIILKNEEINKKNELINKLNVLDEIHSEQLRHNNISEEFYSALLNMVANFVLEYLYDRFIVFGKSIDTKEKKKK